MSKNLIQRLSNAKKALDLVGMQIIRHADKLAPGAEKQFKTIADFASEFEHWNQMLAARETARTLLDATADENDDVPYGGSKAKFQTVRLLGVQAYLAAQWALADRLVGVASHVMCIRSSLQDPKNPPQLVSHFVGRKEGDSKIAALTFYSLRSSFGWPIAISYALRNHFLHDGAIGFFEGPTAKSALKVSDTGWARITERVKEYGVDSSNCRFGDTWTLLAGDDLRKILDFCAPEMDEALGVLIGSACQTALVHVGFVIGADLASPLLPTVSTSA